MGPPAAPQAAAAGAQRPAHTARAWARALAQNRAVDEDTGVRQSRLLREGPAPLPSPCGGSPITRLPDMSREALRGERTRWTDGGALVTPRACACLEAPERQGLWAAPSPPHRPHDGRDHSVWGLATAAPALAGASGVRDGGCSAGR